MLGALVSCTSSVSTTRNFVYSPNIIDKADNPISQKLVPSAKVIYKDHSLKITTMTLCRPVSKITLPPLPDYSKTVYATNKEALGALSNQIAELRATIREYNNKTTQSCKQYKVLAD